jgi:tetratricopeptide (TPR) repeat protein
LRAEANVDAYSLLLKGDFFFHRGAKGDLAQALALFQEVTRLDPNYALAWVRVGDAYYNLGYWSQISPELARSKAMDAVQRALRIDPKLARAYKVLGNIYRDFDWNWQEARNAFTKEIELDPSDLSARINRGYLTWMQTGNIDEGIEAARQMLILNPLDTRVQNALASDYDHVGRFGEAAAIFKKELELNPDRSITRAHYAYVLLLEGKSAEALTEAEGESDEEAKLWVLALIYWALGRHVESDAALLRLKENFANLAATSIAEVHAYRGESDSAFEWLERAYRQRDPGMAEIKFDPLLRGLRKDPRFQALLVKMKLTDDLSASIK